MKIFGLPSVYSFAYLFSLDIPKDFSRTCKLLKGRRLMTDRKDALVKLLAKVEAGEWDTVLSFSAFDGKHLTIISQAYKGSLDAAKALHEAVLQGWAWTKGFSIVDAGSTFITIFLEHEDDSKWEVFIGVDDNPARAWLIAILKALIAGENTKDNDKGE
jgi:hypothetical protein